MTFDMVKAFITLAETRNFSRAAELLFISQPTMSIRIKSLEEEMQTELFKRNNKIVELTASGELFYSYASKLYEAFSQCVDFSRNNTTYKDRLTFSTTVTCWDYGPLRQWMISFCREHPDSLITLLRNSSTDTYRMMLEDKVDLGVVFFAPENQDIAHIPFITEKLYLVAAPHIAREANNYFKLLPHNSSSPPPLIRPIFADIASRLVEESLYMLPSHVISDHPSLYLDIVVKGLGIGLMQESVIESALKDRSLEILDCHYNENPISFKSYLIYPKRKEEALSPIINKLREDLLDHRRTK